MKRQRRNEILVKQVVDRLNIGRIESGKHSISLTTLADLCDYYNVPLEDFFKKIVTR